MAFFVAAKLCTWVWAGADLDSRAGAGYSLHLAQQSCQPTRLLGPHTDPRNKTLAISKSLAKNTQKRQDAPTVGHVHSTAGATTQIGHFNFCLSTALVFVVATISIRFNCDVIVF